jgi:hypothetical protein
MKPKKMLNFLTAALFFALAACTIIGPDSGGDNPPPAGDDDDVVVVCNEDSVCDADETIDNCAADCTPTDACVDNDGDGYGANCDKGADACDNIPLAWTREGCDACKDEDGDGVFGFDCDSKDYAPDCSAQDANIWQKLQGYIDADGDGYGIRPADIICSGATLATGYTLVEGDCDDNDASIHAGCPGCTDADSDGHDAIDAVYCPTGNDNCDSDLHNWTAAGCVSCVDADNDGYGVNCDKGTDCNDTDQAKHNAVDCIVSLTIVPPTITSPAFDYSTTPPTLRVPKNDATNTSVYELLVIANDKNGPMLTDEVTYTWNTADASISTFTSLNQRNEHVRIGTKKSWFDVTPNGVPTTTLTVSVGSISATITVESILSIDVANWCYSTGGSNRCGPVAQDGTNFTHSIDGGSATGTIVSDHIDWTLDILGCTKVFTGTFTNDSWQSGDYTSTCGAPGTWWAMPN